MLAKFVFVSPLATAMFHKGPKSQSCVGALGFALGLIVAYSTAPCWSPPCICCDIVGPVQPQCKLSLAGSQAAWLLGLQKLTVYCCSSHSPSPLQEGTRLWQVAVLTRSPWHFSAIHPLEGPSGEVKVHPLIGGFLPLLPSDLVLSPCYTTVHKYVFERRDFLGWMNIFTLHQSVFSFHWDF